eukprot:275033-Chlamydomonas_euryale.AAC.1
MKQNVTGCSSLPQHAVKARGNKTVSSANTTTGDDRGGARADICNVWTCRYEGLGASLLPVTLPARRGQG